MESNQHHSPGWWRRSGWTKNLVEQRYSKISVFLTWHVLHECVFLATGLHNSGGGDVSWLCLTVSLGMGASCRLHVLASPRFVGLSCVLENGGRHCFVQFCMSCAGQRKLDVIEFPWTADLWFACTPFIMWIPTRLHLNLFQVGIDVFSHWLSFRVYKRSRVELSSVPVLYTALGLDTSFDLFLQSLMGVFGGVRVLSQRSLCSLGDVLLSGVCTVHDVRCGDLWCCGCL